MRAVMMFVTLTTLGGCDETSPLGSGDYVLVDWVVALEPEESVTPLPDIGLELDVDEGLATFVDEDGQVTLGLLSRDRADWPVFCPTNFTSSRVEVADLDDDLGVGGRTVADPFVMAECRGGDRVYVGPAAGTAFDGVGPCRNDGDCLIFELR
ncbi:MAG: hypothetical protein AAF602_16185 [Myxococcota bacterium]